MTITPAIVIAVVRIPDQVEASVRPVKEPKIVIRIPTISPIIKGSPQNPNLFCRLSALTGFVLIFSFITIHLTIMAKGAPPDGTLVNVRLSYPLNSWRDGAIISAISRTTKLHITAAATPRAKLPVVNCTITAQNTNW